jgi:ABC-type sugar transport system substrate-binding protein
MLREAFLRTLVLVAVVSVLAMPAKAQSMQVYGKTGYLSEYDLSGTVSQHLANGIKEYSGPLAVKHVGLCAHDGPKETTGQIRFQATGFAQRRVTATLVFEGVECTYEGVLSESYQGFMNCVDKTSLPLRLWTE